MSNQNILPILIVVVGLFPINVFADFNSESEFYFQTVDPSDDGLDVDSQTFGFNYTSYLKTVPTANHPYDEAAFLERIPQFTVGGGYVQGDFVTLDVDGFSGLANYVYRDSQSPLSFLVGAGITTLEGDENFFGASIDIENDATLLNFGVGFYVNRSTMLHLIYEKLTTEIGVDASEPGFGSEHNDFELEFTTMGLGIKTVNDLGSGSHLSFEANLLQFDLEFSSDFVERDDFGNIIFTDSDSGDADGDGIQFGLHFYPNQTTNLGFEFTNVEVEDSDSSSFKFSFKTSPSSTAGFGLSYETVDSDDNSGETDTIRIFVTLRQ